jgi:hypothetical protein
MKIRPVEAELFHADGQRDGQTDMTKLIVAFHNFANAPKKGCDGMTRTSIIITVFVVVELISSFFLERYLPITPRCHGGTQKQ